MENGTMIAGKTNTAIFRLISLKGALKLETLGMKRSGQSAYAIIKQEFGLKGNKKKVLEDFTKIVEKAKEGIEQDKWGC